IYCDASHLCVHFFIMRIVNESYKFKFYRVWLRFSTYDSIKCINIFHIYGNIFINNDANKGGIDVDKKYLFTGLRVLIVVAAFIFGVFAFYIVGRLMIPFIIGFFIALLMNPLVEFIQQKTKIPRGFAVLASILIILGVISTAITLLVTEIVQGFSYLSRVVPEHYENFTMYMENLYIAKIFPIYENLLNLFRDLDHSERSTILDSMQVIGE